VLRKIFGPKKDKLIGGLGNLLNFTYSSLIIIRVINSRMELAAHVTRMERWKMFKKFWPENLRGRKLSKEVGVYRR
jgi:hypothetical protein